MLVRQRDSSCTPLPFPMLFCKQSNRYKNHSLRNVAHRAFVHLVLGVFLLANFPVPLPSFLFVMHKGVLNSVADDRERAQEDSTPFPCQNGHCGCATARKCWTDCCCHTPSQRRQWAESRGIKPPEYAVLNEPTSQRNKQNSIAVKQQHPTSSCCVSKKPKVPPCCSSSKSSDPCCQDSPIAKSTSTKARTILSILACKCRGSVSVFTSLPWFLKPELSNVPMPLHCLDESVGVSNFLARTIYHRPPSRPPRGVAIAI